MSAKRILWTSGTDDLDAMHKVGRERPWCGSPTGAAQSRDVEREEKLYRIEIEEFPTDAWDVFNRYLEMLEALPKEES